MDVPPLLRDSSTAPRTAFRQAIHRYARGSKSLMSLPRKSTRNGTRGYAHLVEVDVPVARVWRALTDPGLIRILSRQEAEIDPRKGGSYQLGKRNEGGREAHIDIFDVNRRLRLIYLHTPDLPTSESAVVDDFLLDVRKADGVTSLRLLGSGVPDAASWVPL